MPFKLKIDIKKIIKWSAFGAKILAVLSLLNLISPILLLQTQEYQDQLKANPSSLLLNLGINILFYVIQALVYFGFSKVAEYIYKKDDLENVLKGK